MTALAVGALFLMPLFQTPLFIALPALATVLALFVVAAMMVLTTRDLDWMKMDEPTPAFLTVTTIPFTFSIANGITLGILSFVTTHL